MLYIIYGGLASLLQARNVEWKIPRCIIHKSSENINSEKEKSLIHIWNMEIYPLYFIKPLN